MLKNAEDLNFTDTYYVRQLGEEILEQRIVDFLLNISPDLLVTYTLMNGLKYAFSTHNIELFDEILKSTKKINLSLRERRTIRTFYLLSIIH